MCEIYFHECWDLYKQFTLFTDICMGHSCCINNDLVYVFGGDFETMYNYYYIFCGMVICFSLFNCIDNLLK